MVPNTEFSNSVENRLKHRDSRDIALICLRACLRSFPLFFDRQPSAPVLGDGDIWSMVSTVAVASAVLSRPPEFPFPEDIVANRQSDLNSLGEFGKEMDYRAVRSMAWAYAAMLSSTEPKPARHQYARTCCFEVSCILSAKPILEFVDTDVDGPTGQLEDSLWVGPGASSMQADWSKFIESLRRYGPHWVPWIDWMLSKNASVLSDPHISRKAVSLPSGVWASGPKKVTSELTNA